MNVSKPSLSRTSTAIGGLLIWVAVSIFGDVCCAQEGQAAAPADDGFLSLFDGKSLDGWEGDASMFRVQDGAIVAGRLDERIPHNYFLCTKQAFGDFELRLSAKLIGQGDNAGIQFRSRRMPNHHEMIGYQCDMGSAFGRSVWGALYDESRRRKLLAEPPQELVRRILRERDWNEFVIRCQGPRIQIWLNGHQTVDYVEPDESIERSGVIGLQIHGGPPAEAWYKDIRIKQLGS